MVIDFDVDGAGLPPDFRVLSDRLFHFQLFGGVFLIFLDVFVAGFLALFDG